MTNRNDDFSNEVTSKEMLSIVGGGKLAVTSTDIYIYIYVGGGVGAW